MSKTSEWALLKCEKCRRVFATPSTMISEDDENFQRLSCPYCNFEANINAGISFISHQDMNCEVKKVINWEVCL